MNTREEILTITVLILPGVVALWSIFVKLTEQSLANKNDC